MTNLSIRYSHLKKDLRKEKRKKSAPLYNIEIAGDSKCVLFYCRQKDKFLSAIKYR